MLRINLFPIKIGFIKYPLIFLHIWKVKICKMSLKKQTHRNSKPNSTGKLLEISAQGNWEMEGAFKFETRALKSNSRTRRRRKGKRVVRKWWKAIASFSLSDFIIQFWIWGSQRLVFLFFHFVSSALLIKYWANLRLHAELSPDVFVS